MVQVVAQLEDPDEYVLVEAFQDADEGAAHVGSAHFRAAQAELPPHVSTPLVINTTDRVKTRSELGELAVRADALLPRPGRHVCRPRSRPVPRANHHYDVIVIGSGASGSALASRLSEDPQRSVLVHEAGRHYGEIDRYPPSLKYCHSGAFSMPGSVDHWPFTDRLTDDRTISVARGKAVGGSSAVNGTFYGCGTPTDYDGWAAAGNVGWSYEDVLPFFVKAETDLDFSGSPGHGDRGPMNIRRHPESAAVPILDAFRQACATAGFPEDPDINSATSFGVAFTPTNAENSRG